MNVLLERFEALDLKCRFESMRSDLSTFGLWSLGAQPCIYVCRFPC